MNILFYKIFVGTVLVGMTTGIIGCFMLLQKKSLLGDTIAHATLPGLAGMFLIIAEKSFWCLLLGACITSLASSFAVDYIVQNTTLKKDAALGVVLSSFFGLGVIFLALIQKMQYASQSGIDKFLFGQTATLLNEDILVMSLICLIVIATILLFFKEFTLISFDLQYARNLGLPVQQLQNILLCLVVMTIVASLQIVGLILMSSFLIAPAVAALQWTDRLKNMIVIALVLSCCATTAGTFCSFYWQHVPTGPAIVIIATCIAAASIGIKSLTTHCQQRL